MIAMLREAWSVADRTAELERFYESDLVPLAGQSVQAALLAYRADRAMIDDVIAARRAALETSVKHLRLAADRAQARYDLEYLAGVSGNEDELRDARTPAAALAGSIVVAAVLLAGCSREPASGPAAAAADDTPAEHALKHTNPQYRCPMHPTSCATCLASAPSVAWR